MASPGVDLSDDAVVSGTITCPANLCGPSRRAPLRCAHIVMDVSACGSPLTLAELAVMSSSARRGIEAAMRGQILDALVGCIAASWTGGFLLLAPLAMRALETIGQGGGASAVSAIAALLRDALGESDVDDARGCPDALPALPQAACDECGVKGNDEEGARLLRVCARCRAPFLVRLRVSGGGVARAQSVLPPAGAHAVRRAFPHVWKPGVTGTGIVAAGQGRGGSTQSLEEHTQSISGTLAPSRGVTHTPGATINP